MTLQFTYNALNKTQDGLRVLILDPLASGPEISCKLEYQIFARNPVYEAVSYARGQTGLEHQNIIVNGQTLQVQQDVYDILHDLRTSDIPRSLWIDAVCINQADIHERSYQTSLMYLIYSRAQRVLVWICHPLQPITKPADRDSFRHWGRNEGCIKAASVSPYWRDLWAVQDVALARDLLFYLGSYAFTPLEFTETIMYNNEGMLRKSEDLLIPKLDQLKDDQDNYLTDREDKIQKPLELLFERTKDRCCVETRDRIFALLSFASDWSDDVVQVDYSLSFCELYIKILKFHQTRPGREEHGLHGWRESGDRQLRLVGFSCRIQELLAGRVEEEAAALGEAQSPLAHEKTIYHARCGLKGEITFLGPTHKQCISSFRANQKWKRDLEVHYRDKKQELSQARTSDEEYDRILTDWNDIYVRKLRSIHSSISYGYQKSADDETLSIETDEPDQEKADSGPKRFLGTHGIIGFAPAEAQIGDKVYTFWDSDVAVVLRNVSQDRWMIVGRADVAPIADAYRNEDKAWHTAMVYYEGKPDQYVVGVGQSYPWMMNLRLDIVTLQKLTC